MTQREMFETSFQRPRNFFKLSTREQWEIDKKIGILDWDRYVAGLGKADAKRVRDYYFVGCEGCSGFIGCENNHDFEACANYETGGEKIIDNLVAKLKDIANKQLFKEEDTVDLTVKKLHIDTCDKEVYISFKDGHWLEILDDCSRDLVFGVRRKPLIEEINEALASAKIVDLFPLKKMELITHDEWLILCDHFRDLVNQESERAKESKDRKDYERLKTKYEAKEV